MGSEVCLSRRRFLQQSVVIAGACQCERLIETVAAERMGASDIVRVGYIGAGRRAHQLMELPPDARIVAICDVNLARAEKTAAAHGARAFQDYRKLLDATDIDAVVVATPDHWHALPAIHACQAGKDVYCEKPLSLTVVEGRRMVEAARKYDRVFQTGTQQRSLAVNRVACAAVRDGRLGKLRRVVAHNYPSPWECALPGGKPPASLDWNAWCGSAEWRPYHDDLYEPRVKPGWISFRPYSGGEMTAWGAHGFDQIQWALGADDSGPVEIWTEGEPFAPPTYRKPMRRDEGDAACSRPKIVYRYADGTIVALEDGPAGGARFVGSDTTLTIDRGRFETGESELAAELKAQSTVEPPAPANSDTAAHLAHWIECIKSRRRPVADVEIGHRSATVCHLGNIARWTGRRLRWDPASETFPEDKAALALLDRERRKPYELPSQV